MPPAKECAAKPWDKLRKPTMCPIDSGHFRTTEENVNVNVKMMYDGRVRVGLFSPFIGDGDRVSDPSHSQIFRAADLRQMAEFCNELADQLEPKL